MGRDRPYEFRALASSVVRPPKSGSLIARIKSPARYPFWEAAQRAGASPKIFALIFLWLDSTANMLVLP